MLERRRTAQAAAAAQAESPAIDTASIDLEHELQRTPLTTWQSSFIVDSPPGWSGELFNGNQTVVLSSHPVSPPLSHGFSATTLQECSPVAHDVPLDCSQAFPPFRYTSSSLSAALSDTQTAHPSPSLNFDLPLDSVTTTDYCPQPGPSTNLSGARTSDNNVGFHPANFEAESIPSPESPDVVNDHSGSTTPIPSSSYHRNTNDLHGRDANLSILIPPSTSSPGSSRESPVVSPSTAIGLAALTISPISSPRNASLPINLPNVGQLPSASTLFAPFDTVQQLHRRTSMLRRSEQGPLRLSSSLPVIAE
jgi:hypothetical protein